MNKERIEQVLSTKKGAEMSSPFSSDALVYKVMGKMFALVSDKEDTPIITIKCIPADGEMLVQQFPSITPGYYMNKKHWISIALESELADRMIVELSDSSYDLVVSKLPKVDQQKLQEQL
jgi:predicted DNA-binding protein (MmcQ/YjbR family)